MKDNAEDKLATGKSKKPNSKYPQYETKHKIRTTPKLSDTQWRHFTDKYNPEWGMSGYKSAASEFLDKLNSGKGNLTELADYLKAQDAYGLNNDKIANAASKAGGYAPKRNISPMPKENFKVLPWYWPYATYKDYDMAMRGEETALTYEEALAQYKKFKKIAESPATVDYSRTKPKEPFIDRYVPLKFGARNFARDGMMKANEYYNSLSPAIRQGLSRGANLAGAAGQVAATTGAGLAVEQGLNYLWDKAFTQEEQQAMNQYINDKGYEIRKSMFPEQVAKQDAYLAEKAKRKRINDAVMAQMNEQRYIDPTDDYIRIADGE